MTKNIPKSYFFDKADLPLIQLTHTFAQGCIWQKLGMNSNTATYDLTVRDMPVNRNYMLFNGLEEILENITKITFRTPDIKLLLNAKIITKEFAPILKKFKFRGTIYAMREGTVFFPGEPVVRVTSSLLEVSLVEVFLMSVAASNIPFLTKGARIKTAAAGKYKLVCGPLRAQSFEAGLKASRAGYLCGMAAAASPVILRKYNLASPFYIINGQHLFIKSMPSELEAFRTLAKFFPHNCSFMVDTYDVKKGIENAITVAREMKRRNEHLVSICIDSGDGISATKYARKRLNKAGFSAVKLLIAGNFDEYKIKKLADSNTPADIIVSVTEFNTVSDSPKLEVVYKLAELISMDGKVTNMAKLTPGKLSYPGRKQVFRRFKDRVMVGDAIGLIGEKLGEPLLKVVMKNGRVVYKNPSLDKTKKFIDQQLACLPANLKRIDKTFKYPVKISGKLLKMLKLVRRQHLTN